MCDKCGGYVSPENSVLRFEELLNGPMIGHMSDRHLYPERGCPGSPSRVKLIESNPRHKWAYQKMQSPSGK